MCDLWDPSERDSEEQTPLLDALKAIEENRSAAAIRDARQCRQSDARDLVLACAYDKLGDRQEVLRLLAPLLLTLNSCFTNKGRELISSLLLRAAQELDLELAALLTNPQAITTGDAVSGIVKSFYFGGGAAQGHTLYQRVLQQESKQHTRSVSERNVRPLVCQIEFLKHYSSSTHLTDDSNEPLGGGYFLIADEFGCVIDPGFDFLDNFMKVHRIADIDAIVVTHCHDDHNADLPALLSLLYRQPNRTREVQLFLDSKTYAKYEDIVRSSQYIHKPCNPLSASIRDWSPGDGFIDVAPTISLQPIPAQHRLTPQDESHSAVGLHFVLRNPDHDCHLVISGDTAWVPGVMAEVYRSFSQYRPTLVVHTSTACKEEALGILGVSDVGYHRNHLGIRGTVEMISACRPSKVVLSEVGEELGKVVHKLASLINVAFDIPCWVGMMGDPEGGVVTLVPDTNGK